MPEFTETTKMSTVNPFNLSKRGEEWLEFTHKVVVHIEEYTVPQYGDMPDDQASGWSVEFCIENIRRYLNRFGKNQRSGQEQLDLMKIAHYACIAHAKIADQATQDQK